MFVLFTYFFIIFIDWSTNFHSFVMPNWKENVEGLARAAREEGQHQRSRPCEFDLH